jgi:NAD+ kinase
MKLAVTAPETAADDGLSASDITTSLAGHQPEISVGAPESADLVVALGIDGLRAAATEALSSPILSVGLDATCSLSTREPAAVAAAVGQIAATLDSELPTVPRHPLRLSVGESEALVVGDCTVLTTQPARISEYAVATDGTPLTEFRADGVVVATPIGSAGYAGAAGGPRLVTDSGVAVVPIAPFATQAGNWVVEPPLSLTVERETEVTVFADDRTLTTGGTELTVALSLGQRLSVVDPRRLDDGRSNWKNSNESSTDA